MGNRFGRRARSRQLAPRLRFADDELVAVNTPLVAPGSSSLRFPRIQLDPCRPTIRSRNLANFEFRLRKARHFKSSALALFAFGMTSDVLATFAERLAFARQHSGA